MPSLTLDPVREAFSHLPPPVVVFNKSHSGSRLLTELIAASGVFMGAHVNKSHDSVDVLELAEALVKGYYPTYGRLWDDTLTPDQQLTDLAQRVFERHLQGYPGGRWGWKLCETTYIVPVVDYCFPGARFIHLVRDGRDVAFSDHHAPDSDFWRKAYFNTDRIRTWRGMRLTPQAYRRQSHLYNARHWLNSVEVGRNYAAMLRERCLEIRYEDLCLRFDATARRLLDFLNAPHPDAAIHAVQSSVRTTSVGKHRRQPPRKQREVLSITKPLLLSFGYLKADPERPRLSLWHSRRMDDLIDRYRKRLRRRSR